METRIKIPQDIIKLVKLNLKKPIYLYQDTSVDDSLYLCNRKYDVTDCYGVISLDDDNCFNLSENLRTALDSYKSYVTFVHDGDIYIKFTNYIYEENYHDTKICIPKEILSLGNVNFQKTVYLCQNSRRNLYLSNFKKALYCYGSISLDKEGCFLLNKGLSVLLSIFRNTKIHLYGSGDTIIIVKHSD